MNLWKTEGVPHKGWICVGVEDRGKGNYSKCEMCENEKVRFVHTMQHENYARPINAGCICSAKMSDDYVGAKKRDEEAKKKAGRKDYWIKRKWKISKKGNYYLNYNGKNIGVFYSNSKWGCWIDDKRSSRYFNNINEAKMHLFNFIDK